MFSTAQIPFCVDGPMRLQGGYMFFWSSLSNLQNEETTGKRVLRHLSSPLTWETELIQAVQIQLLS